MQRAQPNELDYASTPPWHRRKLGRRILIGTALLLAAGLTVKIAPRAWWQIQMLYWQRQCLNYTAPADQVVYQTGGVGQAVIPAAWREFYTQVAGRGLPSTGTIFLHARTSRGGNRFLVAVDLELPGTTWLPRDSEFFRVTPNARSFTIGTLMQSPLEANLLQRAFPDGPMIDPRNGAITVYAGQLDPDDASHFVVEFRLDTHDHMLDGWVMDDGSVKLERRTTPPPAATGPGNP